MNRRGLTLIELMLAIGLVLILGGLVLPTIFTGLRERSFESGAEVIRNQLLLARAHAQVTRRPVEVIYESNPPRRPGLRARYFLIDAPGPSARNESDPFPIDDESETNPEQVIVESWADRDLPDGLRLTQRPDTVELPAMLRLAVYMPDGSAPIVQTLWIRDDHGRSGKFEVNSWTGLPSFERIIGDAAAIPDESEDPDSPERRDPEEIEDFRPAREPAADINDAEPAPDDDVDPPAEEDQGDEP